MIIKQALLLLSIFLFIDNASAQYKLEVPFPSLPVFSRPTEMQIAGDGTDRIFINEQNGKIYLFHNTPSVNSTKVFLDLSKVVDQNGSETGLLGLAFHPDFKTNGYFYVNYTSSPGGQLTSFISRFQVNPSNTDTVLNATEEILLTLAQPYPNHNGGHLAFGADGFLYAAFGDGGSGGDPGNRAQNLDTLFGKILRLDVDHEANGKHYAIPSDNPFAGNTLGHKEEIYAYGLRNTWKFSFDRTTGKLWAGDVGQDKYEEIDTITNGGNYGWHIMEGYHCYPLGNFSCDSTGLIPPIWEYPHTNSNVSITGGYVYRGSAIPSLTGKYIYGDYGTGRVWALSTETSPATNQMIIDNVVSTINLSSFGEDQNKEIYFVGYNTGFLYQLISSEDTIPPVFVQEAAQDAFHKRIKFWDVGVGSILGSLKSVSWSLVGGGKDTNFFSVNYTPPISACQGDDQFHAATIQQLDSTIAGCIAFTFTDCAGNKSHDTVCFPAHILNGVSDRIASSFSLEAIRPNPFSQETKISYSIGTNGMVKLSLYDELGIEVERIMNDYEQQGKYSLDFDGSKLSGGAYILRLESGGKVISKKIIKE